MESWAQLYSAPNHLKYDTFTNIVVQYFNTCFPMTRRVRKHLGKKPWFTEDLKLENADQIKKQRTKKTNKITKQY